MKRTIQIHIPKAAGTSMREIAESNASTYSNIGSRRRMDKHALHVGYIYLGHRDPDITIRTGILSREVFDNSFRFTFVRNPWDRLVSLYEYFRTFHLTRERHFSNRKFLRMFRDFVNEVTQESKYVPPIRYVQGRFGQANPQTCWMKHPLHFTGRFEHLQNDWRILCQTIGMAFSPLPVTNKTKHLDYRTYYTDNKPIDLVADWFHKEIQLFGYDFDGGCMDSPIFAPQWEEVGEV